MRKIVLNILSRTKPYLHLAWPLCALLGAALLWVNLISNARVERQAARALLVQQTATYAEAYAQYLTRSIAQMDQVTMQLKHSWEHARRTSLLEDMKAAGMFSDAAFVNVSVLDRNGTLRSSTRPGRGSVNFAQADFFSAHSNSNSSALRIGATPVGSAAQDLPWLGRDVVLLTRRLDTDDDEFDGVVLMAIDAGYFTAFGSPAMLGRAGVLGAAGGDDHLRVEQTAHGNPHLGAPGAILPPDASRWSGAAGMQLLPAASADGYTRMLGWKASSDYQVTALVALSLDDALAPATSHWRASRNNALAASVALAVLALLASILTLRAAAREREQDEVRRVYRTATEHANDGFYMASPVRDRKGAITDFRIVDCNEQGAWFYGYQRASLVGKLLSEVNLGTDHATLFASYQAAMETGFYEEDRRISDEPGMNLRWGHRRLVRVGAGLAITLQDISERKAHEAQTARLVNEDSLTGLPNRPAFLHYAQQALERAQQDGAASALLFIDLDDFKQVNDTHGHGAGDRLLQAAAARLLSLLRPQDRVARFGGDEFVVLLDCCDGPLHSASVAERVIGAFAQPFPIGDGVQVLVGASVGIALAPNDGADASTLIQHADMAMYAGKNDGKGQYRYFDHAISHAARTRMQLKQRLADAIDAGLLVLHYQPRVDTGSGQLRSMEALLRWHDPVLGHVSPAAFIPVAEAGGLILRIGELVVEQACAQLAAWRNDGLDPVPVSINISPKQFMRRGLAAQVGAALVRHRIPAHLLQIEITESAMLGEQDEVVAELAALRALGLALYVDDFGTGYSSLSQLQRLRMDGLKVDRAFTAQLGVAAEGKVFFQAIVSMAHALGMSVVAEGVETPAELAVLAALRCDEVQGYLIDRPMPAAQMAALLQRRLALA
ncbi:bifunctional diguanylate cyclase/phosphodiesterase [Massilia sp. S19_KUP03_FR1]|uniref:bifunctional diguanylate cyclase/phosphodiesterase n=1 Tax=Massilia sp. S19_KUP03_FR1 TaxID=3025503 RepID=UPI002FCDBC8E